MATILKRDSGRWQARVRKAGGRQVSRTFSTKAAAESWAKAEETAIERGVWRDRTPADRMTLGQLLQQYERQVASKRNSAPVERYRINRLREDLGHLRLSALSPAALAEWRDERMRAVASSTVLRELSTLGGALSWGIKERQLPIDNPISSIRAPSPGRSRDRRLEQREEQALLEAMEDRPRPRHQNDEKRYRTGTRNGWLKPLVQLALETAMRQGELIALQWENVDLQRRVAFLPDTKNGDARSVPLSSRALEILDSLPSRAAEGRVFPVSQEAVKKAWVRTCARAGVEDLRFHDLRHEATSRLAEKLPNLIELAAVTGHRDLRMLKRYYHPRAEDLALKLG